MKANIYCMGCERVVETRLTDGSERYPHRPDLADVPFWHCDACGAWVGCHYKSTQRTKPLGILATPEMFKARIAIHDLIDPIWKSGEYPRGRVYAYMASRMGVKTYHTGELRTMEEARKAWVAAAELNNQWKFDSEVTF